MTGPAIEAELEECLSRPTEPDVAHAAALEGDLLVLGAGGKMGPSLVALAKRAALAARRNTRVIAVSGSGAEVEGIESIVCDLLEPGALAQLPEAKNVIFMAALKFGTSGSAHLTWAMNTYLPGMVAERYSNSKVVAYWAWT